MKDLYGPQHLIETPFVITNVEKFEMIKYASDAFLATKISFINEIANLCERVGADVHHVAKGMGLDRRIGPKIPASAPATAGRAFRKIRRRWPKLPERAAWNFRLLTPLSR